MVGTIQKSYGCDSSSAICMSDWKLFEGCVIDTAFLNHQSSIRNSEKSYPSQSDSIRVSKKNAKPNQSKRQIFIQKFQISRKQEKIRKN